MGSDDARDSDPEEQLLREIAHVDDAIPPDAWIGERVGRYEVRAQLGSGGMGVVFEAEDVELRRTVALKVLPRIGADAKKRLLREARAASAVAHRNVAAIYEVGEADGRVFLAMELVRGETLRARLRAAPNGRLAIAEALRVAGDLASALARAHASGVVHRDVKPDNVMIESDGSVKVLDFGLAQHFETGGGTSATTSTMEATPAGTPGYMSPEQLRGVAVDARSDVFSFGILFYELLAGERPFGGASLADVIVAISRDAPRPLREVAPDVPSVVVAIVDRCLEKDPAARFADGQALVDALRSVRPGPSRAESSSRNPWKRIAAGALVLGVIGIATTGVLGSRATSVRGETRVTAMGSPLADPNAIFACPQLRASGVEEPTGWLGAAAASIACARATVILGGRKTRTLVPAELLDLPRLPRDDFPRDAFGEPGARDRAIAASKARAAAFLDGDVRADADGFTVRLAVDDASGRELAHGESKDASLVHAIRTAMTPLVESSALPKSAALDPDVATWSGLDSVDALLDYRDWDIAAYDDDEEEDRARLLVRSAELGPLEPLVRARRLDDLVEGHPTPPPIDRSSPARFATTVEVAALLGAPLDFRALADEAQGLAAREKTTIGRATLVSVEAMLRLRGGDGEGSQRAALEVLELDPRQPYLWSVFWSTAYRQPDAGVRVRGFAAWVPERDDAWNSIGHSDVTSAADRARFMRRGVVLSPRVPLFLANFVVAAVRAGRRSEAAALATRAAREPGRVGLVGGGLLGVVEQNEARFAAAYARESATLGRLTRFDGIASGESALFVTFLDVGEILGKEREAARFVYERFIAPEPSLLGDQFGVLAAADACATLEPALARRCIRKVRADVDSGGVGFVTPPFRATLEGASHLIDGDPKAAASDVRPFALSGGIPARILARALDGDGDPDLADRAMPSPLDAPITMVHVRAARRAIQRGDKARARALARAIVDAWSVADAPVPAVDEMRRALRTLR